jgi:hypothetical protein
VNELISCIEEKREFPDEQTILHGKYTEFNIHWKEKGYDKEKAIPFDGTMIEAVRKVNYQLRSSDVYKRIVASLEQNKDIKLEEKFDKSKGHYTGHYSDN